MNQIITILLLLATAHSHLLTQSWPMMGFIQNPTVPAHSHMYPTTVDGVTETSLQVSSKDKMLHKLDEVSSNVSVVINASQPTSQVSGANLYMQTKDSSPVPFSDKNNATDPLMGASQDKTFLDNGGVHESSGSGPLSTERNKPKLDDTEDSGDDDEEDYDYEGSSDVGSGQGSSNLKSRQDYVQKHGDFMNKSQTTNDFYSPFRQPVQTLPPQNSSSLPPSPPSRVSNIRLTVSNQPNLESTPHAPTTRPPVTFAQENSTATSYNLTNLFASTRIPALHKQNVTKGGPDYDYDDESEDDNEPEETSAFEDNDANDFDSSSTKQLINQQPNTNKTSQIGVTHKLNISMTESKKQSVFDDRSISSQSTKNSTTMSSVFSRQTTTRPPIPYAPMRPTQSITRPSISTTDDDEEEEGPDDEDEEEEEDMDEDDHTEGKQSFNSNQFNANIVTQTDPGPLIPTRGSRPTRPMKLPGPESEATTVNPIAIILPSHTKSYPKQTVTTPIPAVTTTVFKQASSVPTPMTTRPASTTVQTTTSKWTQTNLITSNTHFETSGGNVVTVQKPSINQPTHISNFNPMTSIPESPIFMKTPSLQDTRVPTSVTTNINYFDRALQDNDTLTRQIYDKAVEVYQETDKTIRAAWSTVWPPNFNFDSSSIDPLLNQPFFFMLALGGAIMSLVFLMMLVVYIMTYQGQPKDDDISIY